MSSPLGYNAGYFDDDLCGFFHRGDGYKFVSAMEVEASGEYIGAGQSLERELCSVGASSDGLYFGCDAGIFHGLDGYVDDVHHWLDFLAHIIVLILDFDGGAAGKFVVDLACEVFELFLAALETVAVVVADDVGEYSLLDGAFDGYEMIEALVAFGVLGSLPAREHDDKLVGHAYRVEHLVLGVARMNVAAFECDFCHGGVEVLIFQLAHFASVHCIGPFGAEVFYVKLVGAFAYFLVGVEGYADIAVFDLGMVHEVVDGGYYLGYSGLVVGSEQGCTVGDDEVLSFIGEQFGELRGGEDDAFGRVEGDVGAVVALDYAWRHMASAHVGRRVEMGYEAYCGHLTVGVGGECGHQVSVVVEGDIRQAHGTKLFLKLACEYHLSRCGGGHIGEFVALCVELHILEETIYYSHWYISECFRQNYELSRRGQTNCGKIGRKDVVKHISKP